MTTIRKEPDAERFRRYADAEAQRAKGCAGELSTTRDPVIRASLERQLQRARANAAFNLRLAGEAQERGE